MRCVLHACLSYVFIGTLARRKKAILSKLAIIIRVRHDTPHSLNITKTRYRRVNEAGRGGNRRARVTALVEKRSSLLTTHLAEACASPFLSAEST